jgi:nucleotide-binding universal stress UspA family protein
MNTAPREKRAAAAGAQSVFGSVLVGIDGSEEALEAARQAAVLAEGPMTLLAVYDIAKAVAGGTGPFVPAYYDEDYQRTAAEEALARARDQLEGMVSPTGKVVRDCSWDGLLKEIERDHDTLVALGSHGAGRARGFVVGSTATELIHKSPCSVLVARKAGGQFPTRIVVGVDGSPESAVAYTTARDLAERFAATLSPLVAHGGKGVDERMVGMVVDQHREDSRDKPVDALVSVAGEADLLVVGSRGLHGLRSLGSVSERVAHEAGCSVLIVREAPWQRVARALGDEPRQ